MKKDIKRLLLGLFLALLSAQSIVASDSDDGWSPSDSDDESSSPADSFNMAKGARDLASALSGGRPGQPVQQVAQPARPQNAQPAAQQPAQQQNGAAGFQALREKMQNLLQPQQAAQLATQPVLDQPSSATAVPAAQPVLDQPSSATAVPAAQFAPAPPPPPMPSGPIGISRQPVTLDTANIEGDARKLRNTAPGKQAGVVGLGHLLKERRRVIEEDSDSDSEVSDWTDSESDTTEAPFGGFSGDGLPQIKDQNEGESTSESPVSVGSLTDQDGPQLIEASSLSDAQLDALADELADELINAAIQKALRLERLDAAIWKNINALQPKR